MSTALCSMALNKAVQCLHYLDFYLTCLKHANESTIHTTKKLNKDFFKGNMPVGRTTDKQTFLFENLFYGNNKFKIKWKGNK